MHASTAASRRASPGQPAGQWGYGVETSRGKDTPSGHWEIAGAPVDFDWGCLGGTIPAFPEALTRALVQEGGLPGVLGDRHASGTTIIGELGEAVGGRGSRSATPRPIRFSSAASADASGSSGSTRSTGSRDGCATPEDRPRHRAAVHRRAREGLRSHAANRRDFAVPPPDGNLLQRVGAGQRRDGLDRQDRRHFAHRDSGTRDQGQEQRRQRRALASILETRRNGGLILVNLVDFDTEFGHRRDVPGYAACARGIRSGASPALDAAVQPGGPGRRHRGPRLRSDLAEGETTRATSCRSLPSARGAPAGPIGARASLADIAETIAAKLGLPKGPHGTALAGMSFALDERLGEGYARRRRYAALRACC